MRSLVPMVGESSGRAHARWVRPAVCLLLAASAGLTTGCGRDTPRVPEVPAPAQPAPAAAQPASPPAPGGVPVVEDRESVIVNSSVDENPMLFVWHHNLERLRTIAGMDSPETRAELRKRLEADSVPARPKLLYAGLLVRFGDKTGQEFLIRRSREADEFEDFRNVAWVFTHLDWLHSATETTRTPVDMRWAEDFMIEMLQSEAAIKAPERYGGRVFKRQFLGGPFAFRLGEMKGQRAYELLTSLYEKARTAPTENERAGAEAYLQGLVSLKDPRSEELLLEVAADFSAGERGKRRCAAIAAWALAKDRNPKALDLFLKHIADWDVLNHLACYRDERILPALKAALPQYRGKVRGRALLLVAELEGGDPVPKFIEIARDPTLESEYEAVERLRRIKDDRLVPLALELLDQTGDRWRVWAAIDLLGDSKSPEATQALIEALGVDYQKLAEKWGKQVMADNNKEFREKISGHLRANTGQDFGTDRARWREWYRKTYGDK